MKKLAIMVLLSVGLGACGQSGPLYLTPASQTTRAPVVPANIPGAPSTQPLNPQTQQSNTH